MYEYFIGSMILLIIWLLFYILRKDLRKEIMVASIFSAPLGLLEFLFVPTYWNPHSIFELNKIIGFDIESIIFSFAIGGIGSISYNVLYKKIEYRKIKTDKKKISYYVNRLSLIIPLIVILALYKICNLNPIYSAFIGMSTGIIFAIITRRDLIKPSFIGGFIFTTWYIIFFIMINLMFPNFVEDWNLPCLTNILFFGIPIEEIIWAYLFGSMMSILYPYLFWYKISKKKKYKLNLK